jgi:hypothetical protein
MSNKMQRHTVYFIWKILYVFRVVPHPSSGTQTTVSTASGICHTVTAAYRYRGRVGTGLSVLWVAYATFTTLQSPDILFSLMCSCFSSCRHKKQFSMTVHRLFYQQNSIVTNN